MHAKQTTRRLVESAIFLAAGFVLSVIKIPFPLSGGAITVCSMLPLVILGYKYGPLWGGFCGIVFGFLQILEGGFYAPPTNTVWAYAAVILLDYALAWASVGLISGWFGKIIASPRLSMTIGAFVGIFGRFLCSFTSGVLIWQSYAPPGQSPFLYSLIQNGMYLLPEMILTALVAFLLFSFPILRRYAAQPSKKHK